jgi:hypothetical protein
MTSRCLRLSRHSEYLISYSANVTHTESGHTDCYWWPWRCTQREIATPTTAPRAGSFKAYVSANKGQGQKPRHFFKISHPIFIKIEPIFIRFVLGLGLRSLIAAQIFVLNWQTNTRTNLLAEVATYTCSSITKTVSCFPVETLSI